jgi:hypothetical protein
MDSPDPVSFHNVAFFSNFMSGPPNFSPSLGSHQPLASAQHVDGQLRAMSAMPFVLPEPDPIFREGRAVTTAPGWNVARDTTRDQLPGEEDFMASIDEVLGPMPTNHSKDPLAEILDLP